MELTIPSFASMSAFVKRHQDKSRKTTYAQAGSFFSRAPFNTIPYEITKGVYGWDSKRQTLAFDQHTISTMSLLHEACHYFLCPKERLQYDDFGLGPGPDSKGLKCPIKTKEAVAEEEAVCHLSFAFARAMRVPSSAIMEEISYTNTLTFFLNSKNEWEYKEFLSLIRSRRIKRFGINVKYP